MRWICWFCALLAVCWPVSLSAGAEAGCGAQASCGSAGAYNTYYAPACAGPFYGMVPGCSECPPTPCDNAWDGYCQEKARWWGFCYRIGSAYSSCSQPTPAGCANQGYEATVVSDAVRTEIESVEPLEPVDSRTGPAPPSIREPLLDAPPPPMPAPQKTSGSWKFSRFR